MSWPVPERREKLLALYLSGLTYREIAAEYGGTPDGVRGTIRKMLDRDDPLAPPVTKTRRCADRVLQLKSRGLDDFQIAERVGLNWKTVRRRFA